ncbi:MAG: dUTP diphosphatase [Dissulfurispiraceae bacterium]
MQSKDLHERGFQVVSAYAEQGINIPKRQTRRSAGYDIEAAKDTVIESGKVTVVETGLKAFMLDEEVLTIHIRSGIAFKKCCSIINDVGIIDSDYYNNPGNEGHIMVGIYNHSGTAFTVKKGERIAQGIFQKYLLVDGDDADGERSGGIGSTGEKQN